jgi:hypothetical protein
MAKKQTRRSVSLNRGVYDRAQNAAIAAGMPVGKFVEAAVEDRLKKIETEAAIDRFVSSVSVDEPVGAFADTNDGEILGVDASDPDVVRVEYDEDGVT